MRHILVGIGGITAKIKEIIQKIREPIDKAVAKVVGFVADKAKALIARIRGTDQPREEPPQNEAEHDAQVEAGLAAIDGEERKYLENNEISRENAEKVAVAVKKAYPVFKAINVVDGGETWDYDYVASPGRRKEGHGKVKVEKIESTGQEHHILSNKIARALNEHPVLKNIFEREDAKFKYQAKDAEAHKGYQQWHREVDKEVVIWLHNNPAAKPEDFIRFLNDMYQRPEISSRIPGVNIKM